MIDLNTVLGCARRIERWQERLTKELATRSVRDPELRHSVSLYYRDISTLAYFAQAPGEWDRLAKTRRVGDGD